MQEPRRFYDGGTLAARRGTRCAGRPWCGSEDRPERHSEEGVETFALERRLAYRDRLLGELLVPADPGFRTDLTSVPALFAWLVPKTGAHLPAALLHDALVAGRDDPTSYVSTGGHDIDRVEADRVFRDAMADTGTGVSALDSVAAVTIATSSSVAEVPWSRAEALVLPPGCGHDHPRHPLHRLQRDQRPLRPVVGGCGRPAVDGRAALVGSRSRGSRAGAVVVPLALSLLWGRLRMAGAISGVMLAVLIHVTVGLALIASTYLAPRAAGATGAARRLGAGGRRRRRLAGGVRGAQPRVTPILAGRAPGQRRE